jgi:hypothetical protein
MMMGMWDLVWSWRIGGGRVDSISGKKLMKILAWHD